MKSHGCLYEIEHLRRFKRTTGTKKVDNCVRAKGLLIINCEVTKASSFSRSLR